MACSHSSSCPLHPYLNHSLAAWRSHYCDSETGWQGCARYNKSLSGEPMPLALLPNGKVISGLQHGTDQVRDATATQATDNAPPPPAATAPAKLATATTTTDLAAAASDQDVGAVLTQAQRETPSLWQRLTGLFRAS